MKQATTIEEQINLLEQRGIIITDKEKAKTQLLDIGYFRLGSYFFPFESSYPEQKNRNHNYQPNTNFCDAIELYYFDVDLRNILTKYILRIEINIRTYITYTISNYYKEFPTWFVDNKFVEEKYVNDFCKKYKKELKKNPIINRHHKKHQEEYAPAWKTMEFMTFGSIIELYKNLKNNKLKSDIAKHYGYNSSSVFYKHLNIIRTIRNSCAHSNTLFDLKFRESIPDGPIKINPNTKQKLVGGILIIDYILNHISENRNIDMNNEIYNHINSLSLNKKILIQTATGIDTYNLR